LGGVAPTILLNINALGCEGVGVVKAVILADTFLWNIVFDDELRPDS
jgi:hypothetical protein